MTTRCRSLRKKSALTAYLPVTVKRIYYADTKKRVKLPFQDECASFNHDLIQILGEMRTYKQNGRIPPIQKSQKCNGCSLQDICMPRLKKSKSVEAEIKELMTEI